MALIQFNGDTILDDDEGVFMPTAIGTRQPIWEEVQLVRAEAEIGKRHGRGGCDHVIEVKYLHVANVDTIRERLDDLAASSASGNLVIEGLGTYGNCRIKAVGDLAIKREAWDLTPNMDCETRWTVGVTLTFRQMR